MRTFLAIFYQTKIFLLEIACLAQRPERRTCNAMVIGSTPIAGFLFDIYSK